MTIDIDGDTRLQLRGYVERIEDAEAEKVKASEAIKEEYAAAAAVGFDKKALKAVLKRRRADMEKSVRLRATVDIYMRALASFEDTELGQWAKAWEAEQKTMANRAAPAAMTYADARAKRDRSDLN